MDPLFITVAILILLFSVILHEVMHGVVALKFGDRTAEKMGRLTLNPIPHIDPVGTILVPGLLLLPSLLGAGSSPFIFGWAKPVPVNPLNFSNIKKGELYVSLAGVLANFTLALSAAVLFHLFRSLGLGNFLFYQVLAFTVTINLVLGIFNLLPIPPLDGSKVLISLLPLKFAREYQRLEPYGFIILIALLYFGVLGLVLSKILLPFHLFLGVPPGWF